MLCVVLKRLNEVNYLIGLEGSGHRVVHHAKLKRYEGVKRPKWMDRVIRDYKKGN